jgi:integrase/recombinase XerD
MEAAAMTISSVKAKSGKKFGTKKQTRQKPKTRRPGRAISLDEVRKLMTACGRGAAGYRNRAFLALTFGAGLRCAEALAVCPRNIQRHPNGVFIQVENGKGGKPRLIGVIPEFVAPLETWIEHRKVIGIAPAATLICGITKSAKSNTLGGDRGSFGKSISRVLMTVTLHRLAKKAGIEQRVHLHGLRHGHATTLARHGANLGAIAGQLGHSNLATTNTYLAKLDPQDLLSAVSLVK